MAIPIYSKTLAKNQKHKKNAYDYTVIWSVFISIYYYLLHTVYTIDDALSILKTH